MADGDRGVLVTLAKLIKDVDGKKANPYTEDQKTDWINKVEGMVQLEVLEVPEDTMKIYSYEDDKQTNLIVHHPFTDLYVYFLYAMIDYENKDIASYNNNIVMFNNTYENFQKYYRSKRGADPLIQIRNIW